jgi:hypothetical protein
MGLVKGNLSPLYIHLCHDQTDEYTLDMSVSGIDEYIYHGEPFPASYSD